MRWRQPTSINLLSSPYACVHICTCNSMYIPHTHIHIQKKVGKRRKESNSYVKSHDLTWEILWFLKDHVCEWSSASSSLWASSRHTAVHPLIWEQPHPFSLQNPGTAEEHASIVLSSQRSQWAYSSNNKLIQFLIWNILAQNQALFYLAESMLIFQLLRLAVVVWSRCPSVHPWAPCPSLKAHPCIWALHCLLGC